MFDAPLSTILNNGLLGAMLVLALLVIWWRERYHTARYDTLAVRYDDLSEKRLQEALAFKDGIAEVVAEQTETQRLAAEKMGSMADSMKTIAGAIYQSFLPPRIGRPDA